MLSAIAARKAAQAAARTNAESALESPTPAAEEHEEVEVVEPASVVGKRKLTDRPSGTRRRERQQKKKAKRYFLEDKADFRTQQDVIIVKSDSDSVSNSDVSDEYTDINLADEDELMGEVRAPPKRAWSPSMPVLDSSDEESIIEENESLSQSLPPRSLSTFHPIRGQNLFYVSPNQLSSLKVPQKNGTILKLSPEETICIAGTYMLTVLQGTISILGTLLTVSPKPHNIYAFKSSPLPVITAVSSESTLLQGTIPTELGISMPSGIVVMIQELQTGVEGLGRVCKVFHGVFDFARYEDQEDRQMLNVNGAYLLRNLGKDYEPYVLPTSWEKALENTSSTTAGGVYLVKGAKKSGKSTFARTLLNHLLNRFERVAYLECDLGQSEFTPAGMVALNIVNAPCFGPPFTHPTIPNAAHYIGATSPRSSPSHYLSCIQALFRSYELDVQTPIVSNIFSGSDDVTTDRILDTIPLVVNTMGWNKGLGADLTRKIQDTVQPSHVFEFVSSQTTENPDWRDESNQPPTFEPQVHTLLDPIIPSPSNPLHTRYTAADHRALNILSHLHAVLPSPSSPESDPSILSLEQLVATSWRTSLSLCSQPPYAVDWTKAIDRIVLVGSGTEDVVPSEVGRVLNGALVAVVTSWGDDMGPPERDLINPNGEDVPAPIPYNQGSSPPSPTSSTCLGLALIRSLSHFSPLAVPLGPTLGTSTELHLLTHIPPSLLHRGNGARVFVKGEIELPIWGMLDYSVGMRDDGWKSGVAGLEWSRVPYLRWGKGEGVGADKRRVRRNLMRKGQM
ncbi:hypothetical protein AMATHDRAFT_153153 [Amanita thiersii Skay4041]|uniref:Polynucleotide 5'-hydroxyl-kinase GRC3 n=1 Tax=Amanita thiersii Skay4041 TaxID=703135 RepID=A0A2A9NFI7_9AGAR|nr:hypothetical protein AMATHDRAFT_153153 [Amanita thiersii Skay4041]